MFREYAGINGFTRMLDGAVPLDMSNRNLSIGEAVRQGLCDRDFEDGKTERWALLAASSDRTCMHIVNMPVVLSPSVFLSSASISAVHDEDEIEGKENPQDMLTRFDYSPCKLSELDAIVPDSMILQCFLEALPEKYHREKRMFKGQPLERERMVTRMLARY